MKTIKDTRKNLEKKAASIIIKKIKQLLKKQNKVVLGIPGGRSVKNIFKLLKISKIDWNKTHIFFVDERLVPLNDKESNYNLAKKYFPKKSLHPFNYKHPLEDYINDLKAHGGKFDIILLSSGEDCHCAGLFPNYTIKNKDKFFIKFDDSPKPPKKRMSASRKLLEKSQMAILLFFGYEKKDAYKLFKDKKIKITKCPSKLVNNIKESYLLTTS